MDYYKIIKEQEEYPDNLRNKKFVMLEQPFSDLSVRHSIYLRFRLFVS